MIAYFDTSAFVPLVNNERTTERCRELWDRAERTVSTRLLFVETSAAMTRAERTGRADRSALFAGLEALAGYWPKVAVSELDSNLMLGAAKMANRFRLRGYDAVHCAAAAQIHDEEDEVVAASGDRRLLEAWSELGLNTFDAND